MARAGRFKPEVPRKLADHAGQLDIPHSLETGTGKSTLLFSHLRVLSMTLDLLFDRHLAQRPRNLLSQILSRLAQGC